MHIAWRTDHLRRVVPGGGQCDENERRGGQQVQMGISQAVRVGRE